MSDRIKLAEAMGWMRWEHPNRTHLAWTHPDTDKLAALERGLPDPFTDANDDYSVLTWMRNGDMSDFSDFCDELYVAVGRGKIWKYQIGDYARAALKVKME